MPSWSVPAIAATVFIALHYLALRAAAGRVAPGLGAFVVEASAALGILALYALGAAPSGQTDRAGIAWSAASGLCISGAMVLLFVALGRGGPVSATGTLVLGGGVALAALAAVFVFGEPLTRGRAVGIVTALVGVALLATEGT